jgi:hypothetical protein
MTYFPKQWKAAMQSKADYYSASDVEHGMRLFLSAHYAYNEDGGNSGANIITWR